jgi:hypothetical protein
MNRIIGLMCFWIASLFATDVWAAKVVKVNSFKNFVEIKFNSAKEARKFKAVAAITIVTKERNVFSGEFVKKRKNLTARIKINKGDLLQLFKGMKVRLEKPEATISDPYASSFGYMDIAIQEFVKCLS